MVWYSSLVQSPENGGDLILPRRMFRNPEGKVRLRKAALAEPKRLVTKVILNDGQTALHNLRTKEKVTILLYPIYFLF